MTEGVGVYRVIASFQTRPAFGLAISHVIAGVLIIVCGCVVFAVQAFTSVGGSALLTGIPLVLCGLLAYFASKRKEIWLITAYMLVSICSLIFSLALIGAAVTGLHHEPTRDSRHSVKSRQTLDIICLVLAIIAGVSLMWSIILCGMALFYGCCKPATGATYVTDPGNSNVKKEQPPSEAVTDTTEEVPSSQPTGPAVLEI